MKNNVNIENLSITELENSLSNYCSKTSNYEKFIEYIKKKLELFNKLSNFYSKYIFRKHRWKKYMNEQVSIDSLTYRIRKTYEEPGKKIVVFYGNWCQTKQMKNFMPTPGIGLKRKIY